MNTKELSVGAGDGICDEGHRDISGSYGYRDNYRPNNDGISNECYRGIDI